MIHKNTYFKLGFLGVLLTLLLSAISLLFLHRLYHTAASQARNHFLYILSEDLDNRIEKDRITEKSATWDLDWEKMMFLGRQSLQERLREETHTPPVPPPPHHFTDSGQRKPFPGPRRFRGFMNMEFWVVTEEGRVLTSNGVKPPPHHASDVFPENSGEIKSRDDFFRLRASLYGLQINPEQKIYLLARERQRPFTALLFGTQSLLTLVTVATAFAFAFLLTFIYLRKKSFQAREVLGRLEQGDLKARFEVSRWDEFAGLATDFNRMAKAIEGLVERIHGSEAWRKNLLQELGHDLRTPVTSLMTSFETLRDHYSQMSEDKRQEMFTMVEAEIRYFRELLEKLLEIASLDHPLYKVGAENVSMAHLLQDEVRWRQKLGLEWNLILSEDTEALVRGDSHQLLRLIKNAFDNASRFAKKKIEVSLKRDGAFWKIQVSDDGAGFSSERLKDFGLRRDQRHKRTESQELSFSLGLGSVIMRRICEQHGGRIEVQNGPQGGAQIHIYLPVAESNDLN